ncbi:MAG: hypothetical protein SF187_11870 [Deltaproteobacteria bacterium]|nr:hypothetical protein [Deltaproteobacteria bacterium]
MITRWVSGFLVGGALLAAACGEDDDLLGSNDGGNASGLVDGAPASDVAQFDVAPLDAGAIDAPAIDAALDGSGVDGARDAGFEAGPLNLQQGWALHNWRLTDDNTGLAKYTFQEGGLVAIQTANPDPSAYYNLQTLSNVVVRGRFSIQTTSDDDFVGFVFGWQDPQHFYFFDWKQATQPYATCGTASVGASLKVMNSDSPASLCGDFWNSAGSDRTKILASRTLNPVGWKDNGVYDFTLVFKPGDISIEVREGANVVVNIKSNDSTFVDGKFGFYNYSQQSVRYEGFDVNPAP